MNKIAIAILVTITLMFSLLFLRYKIIPMGDYTAYKVDRLTGDVSYLYKEQEHPVELK